MADAELIESLRLAVAAVPDDLGLRVHLGRVLLGAVDSRSHRRGS